MLFRKLPGQIALVAAALGLSFLAATATPAAAAAPDSADVRVEFGPYVGGLRTPGSEFTLDIVLYNRGASASDVRVVSALPKGIEFRKVEDTDQGFTFDCSATTKTKLSCGLDGEFLPLPGPSPTAPLLRVRFAVTTEVRAGEALIPATVSTSTPDSNPTDNATSLPIPISTTVGCLAGRAWNDQNGNGRQDTGEPGIAGLPVYLRQYPGAMDDITAQTTTTDAHGRYSFANVPSYSYQVHMIVAGWDPTVANVGNDKKDSDFANRVFDDVWSDPIRVRASKCAVTDAGLVKIG
jgi:hypothetical protein